MNLTFWIEDKPFRLFIEEAERGSVRIRLGETVYGVSAEFINPEEMILNIDGRVYNVTIATNSLSHTVIVNGGIYRVGKKPPLSLFGEDRGRAGRKDVKISMPGRIVRLMAKEGEEVDKGQAVLVLEAMKMQNEIKSPLKGRIGRLGIVEGDTVEAGTILFSVE